VVDNCRVAVVTPTFLPQTVKRVYAGCEENVGSPRADYQR
jgi:hypothetical protein